MKRRFDLVVFDWDGTLFDSTAAIAHAIQDSAGDLGLPVPPIERARHVIGLGLHDALAYALPTLDPRDVPKVVERYRVHWRRRAGELTLFEGARELIAELGDAGCLLAIATGKSAAGLAEALNELDLAHAFAMTRCADQTEPKPHPAMLNEITVGMATDPARTVMIGDTSHDLRMAASAGVPSIGVTYGAHPREELAAHAPLALVESMEELRAWLRSNG